MRGQRAGETAGVEVVAWQYVWAQQRCPVLLNGCPLCSGALANVQQVLPNRSSHDPGSPGEPCAASGSLLPNTVSWRFSPQVNVYVLGKTFLLLARELCINAPAIGRPLGCGRASCGFREASRAQGPLGRSVPKDYGPSAGAVLSDRVVGDRSGADSPACWKVFLVCSYVRDEGTPTCWFTACSVSGLGLRLESRSPEWPAGVIRCLPGSAWQKLELGVEPRH